VSGRRGSHGKLAERKCLTLASTFKQGSAETGHERGRAIKVAVGVVSAVGRSGKDLKTPTDLPLPEQEPLLVVLTARSNSTLRL
jgi:hypothetical protein